MPERPFRRARLPLRGDAVACRVVVPRGRRALVAADGLLRVAAARLAARGGSGRALYPSAPCEEAA